VLGADRVEALRADLRRIRDAFAADREEIR
jgi:hypothetical protein